MSPASDLAAQFTQLREQVQRAERERAAAEGSLEFAKKRLDDIDKQIKALKVDPTKVEEMVQQLEAQLQKTVTDLNEALVKELREYEQIRRATAGV